MSSPRGAQNGGCPRIFLNGLTIGQDFMIRDNQTLGGYFSFGKQYMDEHDTANQKFESNRLHAGFYFNQADIDGWDLRSVLGYAYGDHQSERQVRLSDSFYKSKADFNSHSLYAGVKGTIIAYQSDWMTLSPELGFNYMYYRQDVLEESGDPALSLKVDAADSHAMIGSAGVNVKFASLTKTASVYPMAFARYEHDFYANSHSEHEVEAALVASDNYKETFVGQNRGEHSLIYGLGLGSDIGSVLRIDGGLVYTDHTHGRELGAGLNVEYLW
ncbi:autotransporter outer membrane beta-barrel domain-containing protein [Aeromonas schubertii]|uniref:Autotransporter outer membrane beta-barrel domain-containing protein n=1 Tax=Aeromonas schubertii TaxID=652 RepID=A0ABS7V7I0_9GAMM|nr:autotransporter outer membrane beta-barrel domain-containing protein [Aeromonas schubertii]